MIKSEKILTEDSPGGQLGSGGMIFINIFHYLHNKFDGIHIPTITDERN
jgi:hypothetical protein